MIFSLFPHYITIIPQLWLILDNPNYETGGHMVDGCEILHQLGTIGNYETQSAWWYPYPSENYESQFEVMIPNIWKEKTVFQITEQTYTYIYIYTYIYVYMHVWDFRLICTL